MDEESGGTEVDAVIVAEDAGEPLQDNIAESTTDAIFNWGENGVLVGGETAPHDQNQENQSESRFDDHLDDY